MLAVVIRNVCADATCRENMLWFDRYQTGLAMFAPQQIAVLQGHKAEARSESPPTSATAEHRDCACNISWTRRNIRPGQSLICRNAI